MIGYRSVYSGGASIPAEFSIYKESLVSKTGKKWTAANYFFTDYTSPFIQVQSFNDIVIGDYVTDVSGLLQGCYMFNNNITIGNSCRSVSRLLMNCFYFNHPLQFNTLLLDATYMLAFCSNFNSTVEFANNIYNLDDIYNYSQIVWNWKGMFRGCTKFNKPVIIPSFYVEGSSSTSGISDISEMFNDCAEFNQNMIIPEYVHNCEFAFATGNNSKFSSHIFFKGKEDRNIYMRNLLYPTNNSLSKYVHVHSNLASKFYSGNIVYGISWSTLGDGNGWYNSAYNIYLYNNYSG